MCVCAEDNQFLECLEYEQKTECKPTFSSVIKDVEVVEGSAARFDCKIEGGDASPLVRPRHSDPRRWLMVPHQ